MSIVWWQCEEKHKTHCLPFKFFQPNMTKEQDVPSNRHSDLFLVLFSFAIFILSIPRLEFPTRVQLPVPQQQLHTYSSRPHSHTVSHTCTQKKSQGTPWPGHDPLVWRKPRWTPSASPAIWRAASSGVRAEPKKHHCTSKGPRSWTDSIFDSFPSLP